MRPKVIVSFPKKVQVLLDFSRRIVAAMTDNPNFKNISPDFAALLTLLPDLINKLQLAFDAAKSRDFSKVAYRDQVQAELVQLLTKIAKHIELVANGDVAVCGSTGFELAHERSKHIVYPLIPAIVTLKHGPISGTMIINGKALDGAYRYEVHLTDGDPKAEENWRPYGDFPKCHSIQLAGLTPGSNCSVRVRGVWATGAGPWSQVVTLMSL